VKKERVKKCRLGNDVMKCWLEEGTFVKIHE